MPERTTEIEFGKLSEDVDYPILHEDLSMSSIVVTPSAIIISNLLL